MCCERRLKEEWEKYLEQTRNHERILLRVFQELELDAEEASPGELSSSNWVWHSCKPCRPHFRRANLKQRSWSL